MEMMDDYYVWHEVGSMLPPEYCEILVGWTLGDVWGYSRAYTITKGKMRHDGPADACITHWRFIDMVPEVDMHHRLAGYIGKRYRHKDSGKVIRVTGYDYSPITGFNVKGICFAHQVGGEDDGAVAYNPDYFERQFEEVEDGDD